MSRHPSNTGNHPGVFGALLDAIETMTDWTQDDRRHWLERWEKAIAVERRRRDYDRDYDRASASISWGGQGGG
jgi:hypothetical protein